MPHLQHAAESAGLIPQPLHLRAGLLRRADDARACPVDDVDHLVSLVPGHRHLRERRDLLEVVGPRCDAEPDISAGLFLGLCDVHRTRPATSSCGPLSSRRLLRVPRRCPSERPTHRSPRQRAWRRSTTSRCRAFRQAARPSVRRHAATDSGIPSSLYGASCSLASNNSCVGVLADTVSPASRRTTMSRLVSNNSRVSVGVRPIIAESVGSEPGPMPPMIRPWVRWSSSISRSAVHSGL